MKIIELDETHSTNEYCKRVDNGEDLIVIAKRQSAGRGTKGRSFVSDDGGLYISIMKHYEDFPAKDAFKIMVNSCVAVCRILDRMRIKPQIRWANDVLVGGKKICGTLIENTFRGEYVTRSIVGIGINVNNKLPIELQDIATTLKRETDEIIPVEKVKELLFEELEKEFNIEDYKKYTDWLGSEVILKTAESERKVKALDISADGRLMVEYCGKTENISAAEVSLRL